MQRLLVVDDDVDIRTLLAEQLDKEGFVVATAQDGREMFRVLEREQVDLIVLDLNLPREDGMNLCRTLRARGNTPVIMLTARCESNDRIVGLEIGADDYVTKPFEPRELLARIRNVLRRADAMPAALEPVSVGKAKFSNWTLDLQRRHLVDFDGRVVVLSAAEFCLLRALVTYPNRILTRERLVELSSGRAYESPRRGIDLQISRLRHKLGDDKANSALIKTIRNEGYIFASKVVIE